LGFDEAFERLKRDVMEYDERARAPRAGGGVVEGRSGGRLEIAVTLDLDGLMPDGFPSVTVSPAQHFQFRGDYDLRVNACKNGIKRELVCLEVIRSTRAFR
jgi:hypothetical protein